MSTLARKDTDTVYNLLSPEHLLNPFSTYTKMREHYPVCQVEPGGYWAVSRFDDVQYVLKRYDLFSSTAYEKMYSADWLADDCKSSRFIVSQDPPQHSQCRPLVNKAFTKSVINTYIPLITTTAQKLVDEVEQKQSVEFMEDFAYPYIGTVIRHILGIDDKQSLEELRRWMELEEQITPTRPSDQFIETFEATIRKQNDYFNATIADRRKSPKQDLISVLVNAEIDGQKLTDDMLRSAMGLLVSAGFETTIQMLNHAIIRLSQQPELLDTLRASPELIPVFTEELLRHTPAVHAPLRLTTRAVELSGVTIPKNALVMVLVASANRDPSQFPYPDTFDISRPNGKHHLSFGRGIHTCIGEALARLEIRIALETLVSRVTRISCPPNDELAWTPSMFTRGVNELPANFNYE